MSERRKVKIQCLHSLIIINKWKQYLWRKKQIAFILFVFFVKSNVFTSTLHQLVIWLDSVNWKVIGVKLTRNDWMLFHHTWIKQVQHFFSFALNVFSRCMNHIIWFIWLHCVIPILGNRCRLMLTTHKLIRCMSYAFSILSHDKCTLSTFFLISFHLHILY